MEQDRKQSKKENRKERKKMDKAFVIAIVICVVVVLTFILVLALIRPVSALIRRGETIDRLERTGEVRVVLTDPLEGGDSLFSTAEIILSDEEAVMMRDQLLYALENSEFDEMKEAPVGVWKTTATVYIGEDQVALYLDEDSISVEWSGNLVTYEIKDRAEDSYESLYRRIRERLRTGDAA